MLNDFGFGIEFDIYNRKRLMFRIYILSSSSEFDIMFIMNHHTYYCMIFISYCWKYRYSSAQWTSVLYITLLIHYKCIVHCSQRLPYSCHWTTSCSIESWLSMPFNTSSEYLINSVFLRFCVNHLESLSIWCWNVTVAEAVANALL